MSADDIIEIISAIPKYIVYVYPGYITLYTYYFFRGKTLKDTKQILIKSILISYIYISITGIIPVSSVFWATIGYILLSVLVAYICFRIVESKWILNVFKFFKISTTFYDNDIDALAGVENSAWLVVYIKDEKIALEGSLGHKELENDKERYITLESYTKYKVKDGGILEEICSYKDNYNEKVVIKYDVIKYIEKRESSVNDSAKQ